MFVYRPIVFIDDQIFWAPKNVRVTNNTLKLGNDFFYVYWIFDREPLSQGATTARVIWLPSRPIHSADSNASPIFSIGNVSETMSQMA